MAKECLEIGADTAQFFTRNPRGGKAKDINKEDINEFLKISKDNNFTKIVAHAPYTMNICSSKDDISEFSKNMMIDDLRRMEYIPNNLYNFHPGSHTGQGISTGIEKIVDALNLVLKEDMSTTVLLETMSGKGSEVGGKFEEIKEIINGVKLKSKIGVCLDTCHISDAGYDINKNFNKVMDEFDRIIGFDKLKAIHLNDSKNPIGSKKDRHEKIGKGFIEMKTFKSILTKSEFEGIPFILETPQPNLDGYKEEIIMLKNLVED